MKFKILLPLLILYAFTACKEGTFTSQEMYLGGLIVNPTSDYIVLLRKDVVIDTFYLNEENRFGGNLSSSEKGLYVFKHPPENQVVYLEPGDSTMLFTNTLDFDESLAFSGKGAEKSNYLNDMYLLNQANNDFILRYYNLEPSEFAAKSDSIRENRIEQLKELSRKNNFSEEFLNIANASINYEFYDLRERYAYLIRRYSKEDVESIPEEFHSYRKDISFNDEELEDYYVYLNLIDDYLRTRSLEDCKIDSSENVGCFNLTDHQNINRRITLADSLIQNKRTKNLFIDRLAAQGIIFSKTEEQIGNILDHLKEINYSGNRTEDFQQMAGLQKALLPGNNLSNLTLLNTENKTLQLNNISNKRKITYHWSVNSPYHYMWQQNKITDLREKYPEIDFIGININKGQFEEWKGIIKNYNYLDKYEYKLSSITVNEKLLSNYLNKLMFLDASGEIIIGNIKLNSLDLETRIVEFLSEEQDYYLSK